METGAPDSLLIINMFSFSENRTICRTSGKALENSREANPSASASES
jgi:hypothetical protein